MKFFERSQEKPSKNVFNQYFKIEAHQEEIRLLNDKNIYVSDEMPSEEYVKLLESNKEIKKMVQGLHNKMEDVIMDREITPPMAASLVEFLLDGLHANKKLNKDELGGKATYKRRKIEI